MFNKKKKNLQVTMIPKLLLNEKILIFREVMPVFT